MDLRVLCWVGAVLVAVREVLGPTVASSGGCKSGTQSKASVG